MLLSKQLNDKMVYGLLLAFAFSFPFGNIYGTVIIFLLSALWLLKGNVFSKVKIAFTTPLFLSYSFLFLIQFVWLFNTEDFARAFYLIQCNASMLVLPLLFLTFENDLLKAKRKNILLALILGCIVISIVTLSRGVYRYHLNGEIEMLFYSRLTQNFYHPGFMSIQFAVCIVVLLLDVFGIERIFPERSSLLKSIIVGWLVVFMIFLSSKIGFVVLTLIVMVSCIHGWMKLKNVFVRSLILCIPVLISVLIYNSEFGTRIGNAVHSFTSTTNSNANEESTAMRIIALHETSQLIKTNWLLGTGTGDVWGDLRRSYFVDLKSACLKEKVIPHNQYLNSFAKFGIIGIISLLALLFFPLMKSWNEKYNAAFYFMLLIILNCMVEDVFEVQNGVVFTSFFYSYFFLLRKNEISD